MIRQILNIVDINNANIVGYQQCQEQHTPYKLMETEQLWMSNKSMYK